MLNSICCVNKHAPKTLPENGLTFTVHKNQRSFDLWLASSFRRMFLFVPNEGLEFVRVKKSDCEKGAPNNRTHRMVASVL